MGDKKMVKTEKPLYALHTENTKQERNMGIAITCFTIWIVLIAYLGNETLINNQNDSNLISSEMESYNNKISDYNGDVE